MMASYSGDINGTYGPSSATAPLYVSSNCASYCQSCTNSMVGSHWGSQGLLNWISSSWSEADDAASKFAYSNNYAGDGSVSGQLFPKGAFLQLISVCSCILCDLNGMLQAVLQDGQVLVSLSVSLTKPACELLWARYIDRASSPGHLPNHAARLKGGQFMLDCHVQDPTTMATACPTARPEPTTPRRATATAAA